MNVFEDLLDELKEENLLEDTVLDKIRAASRVETPVQFASAKPQGATAENADVSNGEDPNAPAIEAPSDPRDFFRKRAMEEVSSLQMVDHVLSGVEREHMKVVPVAFNDLQVKKALHTFLNITEGFGTPEHVKAEFVLMERTQAWSTALSERDEQITVANVRRFCENSRPALSSQALMALARFYRNSPFSEVVRGKFDFVMTRLFSRGIDEHRRRVLFEHAEMIGHISTLYNNWSSIALHDGEESAAEVAAAVVRFKTLIGEADQAERFGDLIEADLFNRIREFKEELGEMFYAPDVTAAAIDCNIRLGNRYVDLVEQERELSGAATIEEKYGYSFDQIVSNAAGKTLLLVDLLRNGEEIEDVVEARPQAKPAAKPARRAHTQAADKKRAFSFNLFGVNRWLLAILVITAFLSGGVYVWAEKFAGTSSSMITAKELDINDADVRQHILKARTTNETVYGVIQPTFESMDDDRKKAYVQKVLAFAQDKGYKKVNLLNEQGRTVAYSNGEQLELFTP
ncbi:MAG: hypothetical protein H0V76_12595 [Blastocatellia bacterium]|nr:hypothetical protein [Blastocatellia bacterium]